MVGENYNVIAFYKTFLLGSAGEIDSGIENTLTNQRLTLLADSIANSLFRHAYPGVEFKIKNIPKECSGSSEMIRKYIEEQADLGSLYFFQSQKSNSVIPVLDFNRNVITNTSLVDRAANLFLFFSKDKSISEEQIYSWTIKVYMFLFGQMTNDFLIEAKKYPQVHYILDHSEALINEIIKDLQAFDVDRLQPLKAFLKEWQGYIERYRAIVFLEQAEYNAAVKHIFNAVELNPFFPYSDYQSLKQEYTKKYVADMIPIMHEVAEIIGSDPGLTENTKIAEELKMHLTFTDITFHYTIIQEILGRNSTKEIIDQINDEMDKLDSSEPFLSMIKCEVLKFIPKGTEKMNAMYVDQFEPCINLLEEMLLGDPDFALIKTKVGILRMMKGWHFNNENDINKGIEEYKKGMHLYSQLGLNIKN